MSVKTFLIALVLASQTTAPIFQFETDGFWLNLHHFLYVLGRARNNTSDSKRGPVVGAITDGDSLETFAAEVATYSAGVSTKDAIFDRPLTALTKRIASVDDNGPLPDDLDPDVLKALRAAAPKYRAGWWPRHSASNATRIAEIQPLVNRYGGAIASEIARLWMNKWPPTGFDIQVSAYANWGGAYSTENGLIVLSGTDSATTGTQGLESVFHESMHQWDDDMDGRIGAIARSLKAQVPRQLSHSLIFYTAGYVVSKAVPGHQPYALKNGLWNRGLIPVEDLDRFWRPYLEGRAVLDDALRDLLTSGKR